MIRARRGERGVVAVFVAIALVVIFAFMVLSMNIGHHRVIRGQLQNATDAAALAAAKELDGTTTPLTNGQPQYWAVTAAAWHPTDNDQPGVVVDPNLDFEFGWWDPFGTNPATSFYPLNSPGFNALYGTDPVAQARNVNAVHVTAVRNESRSNAVTAWAGNLLNKPTMSVYADAIAINGGPCGSCPTVPLTFFGCNLYYNESLQCWTSQTFHYAMSPDPSDNIGYSSVSPTLPASTSTYRSILECGGQPDCCTTLGINTQQGQSIPVSNGNQLNPLCGPTGFDQFCHADPQGNCSADSPIILAPVVDGQCPPKFNQSHTIIGTAKFRMTKLVCQGNQKYMEFEFRCNETDDGTTRYGCGFWGTGPTAPRLVR
jgi:hypothetical protein